MYVCAVHAGPLFSLPPSTAFTIWPTSLPAFSPSEETEGLLGDVNVLIFVVSFVAVVSWTMLQVLVAVLRSTTSCPPPPTTARST